MDKSQSKKDDKKKTTTLQPSNEHLKMEQL
jgi:hypothetical protein